MSATQHLGLALLVCAICANAGDDGVATGATAGARAYASAGKLRGPLELQHAFLSKPRLGESFVLDLSMVPSAALSQLRLEINLDEGLQLASGGTQLARESGPVEAGEATRERVDIAVLEPGLHYIHVVARMSMGDRQSARTLALPVQIGAAAQRKAAGVVALDERGERIVSLPAE